MFNVLIIAQLIMALRVPFYRITSKIVTNVKNIIYESFNSINTFFPEKQLKG